MKLAARLLAFVLGSYAASTAVAQALYPDFALVVQVPGYEAFLKNLGSSPIRVDGYHIGSLSGSLTSSGWARLGAAGPPIVAALGLGADQFVPANPMATSLAEFNLFSSATWQPGQSWSIGFPFNTADPDFDLDAVLRFTSPDGLVLTGGTVASAGELTQAALVVIPEPSTAALCLLTAVGIGACRIAARFSSPTSRRRAARRFDAGS